MSKEPIKSIINLPQIIKKVEIKKEEIEEVKIEEVRIEEVNVQEIKIEEVRIEEIKIEEVRVEEVKIEEEEVFDQPIEESIEEEIINTPIEILPEIQIKIIDPLHEIVQETVIKGPTKLSKLLRKPKKEKTVEESVCNALNWCLFNNNKPKIDPEDEFFLEDENIENEFPDNTEEHIQHRLDKFMERWSDTEIKDYSNNQKKRINHIIRNEKRDLNGIIHLTNIELYKNKYQYNFILRNLINLIKVKLDQLDDEGLSQEESLKKFNQFDKNKILEKYNDKFNHWDDRARDTYKLPTGYEWTIQPSIK
jgi:prolactin regulatory element-binding protein